MTSYVEGDPYPDLLQEMGGTGFPTLKILDAQGNALGEPQGRSIESFQATLTAIADCAELEAKAERTPEEEAKLFMSQLELGQLGADEAMARFEKLTALSDEQRAELQGKLVTMELEQMFQSFRSEEDVMAAMSRCAEMVRQGRVPTGRSMVTMQFWGMSAQWAEDNGDAEVFEKAYTAFKELLAGEENPRVTEMLEQMQAKLAELKGEGSEDVEGSEGEGAEEAEGEEGESHDEDSDKKR